MNHSPIDPASVDVLTQRGPRAVHGAWENRAWRRDEARRAAAEAEPAAAASAAPRSGRELRKARSLRYGEVQRTLADETADPDARRWRVTPQEAAFVRALLPGVLTQEAAAASVGVSRKLVQRPAVVRALAEARAEVSPVRSSRLRR
jgi:hypothetical protein